MFNKFLAKIGIGGASIKTKVLTKPLMPGKPFKIEITVKGGKIEQAISGVEIDLNTIAERVHLHEKERRQVFEEHTIVSWYLKYDFILQPEEVKTIPFEGVLDLETPISELLTQVENKSKIEFKTYISLKSLINPKAKIKLDVLPTSFISAFIESMGRCGFVLEETAIEIGYLEGKGFKSETGVYQKYVFKPNPSNSHSININFVEVAFIPSENHHQLFIIADKFLKDGLYKNFCIKDSELDFGIISKNIKNILSL